MSSTYRGYTFCEWCGKQKRTMSQWEQFNRINKVWQRLCKPCATRRLNNPYNALLSMRKVTPND